MDDPETQELITWLTDHDLTERLQSDYSDYYRLTPLGQNVAMMLFAMLSSAGKAACCRIVIDQEREQRRRQQQFAEADLILRKLAKAFEA